MIINQQLKSRIESKVEPSDKIKRLATKYGVDWQKLDWKTTNMLVKDYSSEKEFIEQYLIPEFKNHSNLDKTQLLELESPTKIGLTQIEKEKEIDDIEEQNKKVQEEYSQLLEQIKSNPHPNIQRITWKLREFIKLVLSDKTEKHTLIIVGK